MKLFVNMIKNDIKRIDCRTCINFLELGEFYRCYEINNPWLLKKDTFLAWCNLFKLKEQYNKKL